MSAVNSLEKKLKRGRLSSKMYVKNKKNAASFGFSVRKLRFEVNINCAKFRSDRLISSVPAKVSKIRNFSKNCKVLMISESATFKQLCLTQKHTNVHFLCDIHMISRLHVRKYQQIEESRKMREVSMKSKNFICIMQLLAQPEWLKTHHVKVSAFGVSLHAQPNSTLWT